MVKRKVAARAVVILLVLTGSSFAWQATAPATDRTTVAEQVISREKASVEAWKRQDRAFYEDYWAEDMTEFLPQSTHLGTKAEVMPKFKELTESWRLRDLEMQDPRVQVYGEVAVLTYVEKVAGEYDGKPVNYVGKVTMVYVKQKGTWRGVHYHESTAEQ